MKYLFLFIIFLSIQTACLAQSAEIKRIMEKAKAGEELTEAEEAAFEKWLDEMGTKMEAPSDPSSISSSKNSLCPPPTTTPLKLADLTRESYIAMAKGLMAFYGPKSGDLSRLKPLVEHTENTSDGANMGALFIMQGAGSAAIYASSYSVVQKPDDILTANNLGIALMHVGEYNKSLQVLKYADRLNPGIGLIICNMGWVFREMGYLVQAKQMFEKALKYSPEMTSAYLGLGLLAQCEGNYVKAEEYLRKALADNYSAVGFAAYKKAKESQPPKPDGEQGEPLSQEKGDAGDVNLPDLPLYLQMEKTMAQKEVILNYSNRISSSMKRLQEEYNSTLAIVRQQREQAINNPDNAIIFWRDFSKELMLIQDVTELLFGEYSDFGKAVTNGGRILEQNGDLLAKDLPIIQRNLEETIRLTEQMALLIEQMGACGDNEPCIAKIQAKIDALQDEGDQLAVQFCLLQKIEMDNTYSATYKAYITEYKAFKEAVKVYYVFTIPLLERIYSPEYNTLQNLYREMFLLSHEIYLVGLGAGLPEMAEEYLNLKCIKPVSPTPTESLTDQSSLPKNKPKKCPDNHSLDAGSLKMEINCERIKVTGGNGTLSSVKKDAGKRETNIIVKKEGGSASENYKIATTQGNTIKDISATSNTKTGTNGLKANETVGRMAVEAGPKYSTEGLELAPLAPLDPVGIAPLTPVGIAPLTPVNGSTEPTTNPGEQFELAPLEPIK